MMKGILTIDNQPVVMIGLSFGNLRKFLAQPRDSFIKIIGKEMELPFDILIFSGETEAAMMEFMQHRIGPDTIVHIDEKLKS